MKKLNILVVLLLPQLIFAGGWTQKKGEGIFKVKQDYITSVKFYDMDGEIQNLKAIKLKQTANLTTLFYTEVGFSNSFTAIIDAPVYIQNKLKYEDASGKEMTESFSGPGDLTVGLKYGFFQDKKIAFSISALAGIPIGEDEQPFGLHTGFGSFTETIKLGASSRLRTNIYIQGWAGFTNKENAFTDDISAQVELVYHNEDKLCAKLIIEGISPLENGGDNVVTGLPGFYANDQGFLSIGPEISYTVAKGLGVFAAGFFKLKGQMIHAAPLISGGIFYKMKKKESGSANFFLN